MKDGSLSQNENTKRSYKSKKIEFDQYYKIIFAKDKNPEFVTKAKLFGFLNYTAYRTRKQTRHGENEDISQFDLQKFWK